MTDPTFWPFWIGGAAVAAVAVAYPWMSGRTLGVSSQYESAIRLLRRTPPSNGAPAAVESIDELERALLAETEAEFGPAPAEEASEASNTRAAGLGEGLANLASDKRRAPLFLAGIVVGGIASRIGRPPAAASSLGASFDLRFHGLGTWGVVCVLFFSGILIGFGTRMAGGCTSGHGISGLAMGQRGSLLSTATFWGVAVAVAWAFGAFLR